MNQAQIAESSPFLSLRNFAKQSCGNPEDLRALRSNHPHIKKAQDSQGGLPRRFYESARNDKFLDSSLAPLPQNDNFMNSAESKPKNALDSANL